MTPERAEVMSYTCLKTNVISASVLVVAATGSWVSTAVLHSLVTKLMLGGGSQPLRTGEGCE